MQIQFDFGFRRILIWHVLFGRFRQPSAKCCQHQYLVWYLVFGLVLQNGAGITILGLVQYQYQCMVCWCQKPLVSHKVHAPRYVQCRWQTVQMYVEGIQMYIEGIQVGRNQSVVGILASRNQKLENRNQMHVEGILQVQKASWLAELELCGKLVWTHRRHPGRQEPDVCRRHPGQQKLETRRRRPGWQSQSCCWQAFGE